MVHFVHFNDLPKITVLFELLLLVFLRGIRTFNVYSGFEKFYHSPHPLPFLLEEKGLRVKVELKELRIFTESQS
jgi:hypothetical protein